MKLNKMSILKMLTKHKGGIEQNNLLKKLAVSKGRRKQFTDILVELISSGEVIKGDGNRLMIADSTPYKSGKLFIHREGYGFVTLDDGGDDLFIPARELQENLHGDRVRVVIEHSVRDGRKSGRIISTLERGYVKIIGRFEIQNGSGIVVPVDTHITARFFVPNNASGGAISGQVVVATIIKYPSRHSQATAQVVEILGMSEEFETDILTVIRSYDLPDQFSVAALIEARSIKTEVVTDDIEGRIDLRGLTTFTIDGETAKDFDDAVAVSEELDGQTRLWVSIADVTHYVISGSAIDKEAYLRGTSIYFPDRCLPMLPEELSNGICSLKPNVDRLTMTAELIFNRSGIMQSAKIYPSIIRSRARLTYSQVRNMLMPEEKYHVREYEELIPDITIMAKLAALLSERRINRGSINFDLPEAEIIVGINGQTEAIIRAERNIAHHLIEEFMLAANEAVASYLSGYKNPAIYRVHEPPDPVKFNDFRTLASSFGYVLGNDEGVTSKDIQNMLAQIVGKPEERMLNELLLRHMRQARYSVDNLGHFGLASPCYTHFTSPIRRYPDLQVHRLLKAIISNRSKTIDIEKLTVQLREIASYTSSRERIAMEAEREIVQLRKLQFMSSREGDEFDGIVISVTPYGLYVELVDIFVEGLLAITDLPSDNYRYLEKQHFLLGERTRTIYRIGDQVRIRLARVDMVRKQIDLIMLSHTAIMGNDVVLLQQEYPRLPVKGKRPEITGKQGTKISKLKSSSSSRNGTAPRRKR